MKTQTDLTFLLVGFNTVIEVVERIGSFTSTLLAVSLSSPSESLSLRLKSETYKKKRSI